MRVTYTLVFLAVCGLAAYVLTAYVQTSITEADKRSASHKVVCASAQLALARIQTNDPEDFQIVLKLYTDEGC